MISTYQNVRKQTTAGADQEREKKREIERKKRVRKRVGKIPPNKSTRPQKQRGGKEKSEQRKELYNFCLVSQCGCHDGY